MATHYVDDSSPQNYMGAYEGEHGITIPGTWTVAINPPTDHATQTTTDDGATWSAYP